MAAVGGPHGFAAELTAVAAPRHEVRAPVRECTPGPPDFEALRDVIPNETARHEAGLRGVAAAATAT